MIEIPKQLQNPEFRFILLQSKSKLPIEKEWEKTNNYKYDDIKLLKHLENSGNYGVLAGPGNLRLLDIDDKDLSDYLLQQTNTFSIKTCGKLTHFYFIIKNIQSKTVPKKFELRCDKQYVVGPGCYADDEKKNHHGTYDIIKDIEITETDEKYLSTLLQIISTEDVKTSQLDITDTNFVNIDKDFIEKEIFQNIKYDIRDLINTHSPKGNRSDIDEKIIVHLILCGYAKYIQSIFKLYPCGDKYLEHNSPDIYLQHSIKNARKHSGLYDDNIPLLHKEIFDLPKVVIEHKIDDILERISKIGKAIHREPLLIDINKKTKIGLKILRDRIKEIETINNNLDLDADEINGLDLVNTPVHEYKWHINSIFPIGQATMIFGDPSSFKSGFALMSALSLLSDNKLLLSRFTIEDTSKPKIIYYSIEMGAQDSMITLTKYFQKGLNVSDSDIKNLIIRKNFSTSQSEIEYIKRRGAKIVVLDSLKRIMQGNENDSSVANEFYMKFVKPLKDMGVSVVVIHHSKKPNEKDTDNKLIHRGRGSTDITAHYDIIWQAEKIGDDDTELDENFIASSATQIIKDYDVVLTRAKDSRILSKIYTFTFHVHADENEKKTTFTFVRYHKAKQKESLKNKLLEYINITTKRKRIEIVNYFSEFVKTPTVDRYLKELLEEGKVSVSAAGVYSTEKPILLENDSLQAKLE